jgi:hypothetical protein
MKERPILFSTPMVQAILSRDKTMTRRTIKPQPFDNGFEFGLYHPDRINRKGEHYPEGEVLGIWGDDWDIKCPFGQIGDRLWVREASCPIIVEDRELILYRADGELNDAFNSFRDDKPWTPSIFMPRSHSRITLEITNVRVERLQNISEEDAKAEGINTLELYPGYDVSNRGKFEGLWNYIHGNRCEAWESNPWVWVIEFKRV